MDVGILYAVVAGVGMIVEGVVLNRILATGYKSTIDRQLCKLLVFFMVFSFVDMTWGMFMSSVIMVNLPGYILLTYLFHTCAALSAFFWAGYSLRYMKLEGTMLCVIDVIRTVFLVVQLYIIISNIWNHRFFRIREDYVYESYSMRSVNFFIQFAYYVALIFSSIFVHLRTKDSEQREKSSGVIVFSIFPLAFGVGQILWPDAPMYSLGFMVTSVLIHSFIVTKYREDYLSRTWKKENDRLSVIASGLSDDFQAIYCVDMETNAYEIFSNSSLYHKYVDGEVIIDGDFFENCLKNFDGIVYPDDCAMVREMLGKDHIIEELSTKKSFSFNYRVMHDGNVKYYMLKVIRPSFEEGLNKIIVGVFDDDERVHDEMEKSRQLRLAMEKAESANRAKTSFLFSMSHDVRTPMNAILGFADIAKRNINNPEKVEECLEKVSQSGQHLLALINDVLSMSRLEAGKVEETKSPNSISCLITRVVSILNGTAVSKGIKFVYEYINVKNDYVYCDETHLNQILINIISNSIKYTNEGGEVKISIEQMENKEDRADYVFTVTDNGIGMSREFQKHIFDEFAREQSSTMSGVEGTGLGMSIVKKLVDLMGGKIRIKSKQNEGTEVRVNLQFDIYNETESDEPEKNENDLLEDRERIKGMKVLLVDDNELNREIARDTLEDMGLIVEEACDGQDSLDKLMQFGPGYFGMVLMDVQMPRMDGYEATRQIRQLQDERLRNIPVVAITANAFEEDKRNAKEAGMNDHLVKPIEHNKVLAMILKYL